MLGREHRLITFVFLHNAISGILFEMRVEIRKATTPYEIDGAVKVRHTVFAEEEHYYQTHRGSVILDHYDILPTTANFIALVNKEIIGTIRFTQSSSVGIPAQDQFDFKPYLPYFDQRIISGSMFCVKKRYRGNSQIARGLLWFGMYWGIYNHATHVLAPVNPVTCRFFARTGFRTVAQEFVCQTTGLPTLPMVLQLSEGCQAFLDFVKTQERIVLSDTFAREIYEPEERIITCGETGKSCYYIVDGKVRVSIPMQNGEIPLREHGPGEIFGEETLFANEPHTVNVSAITSVTLMVLDEANFRASVLQHPVKSFEFFRTMSKRLEDTQKLLLTPASRTSNALAHSSSAHSQCRMPQQPRQ